MFKISIAFIFCLFLLSISILAQTNSPETQIPKKANQRSATESQGVEPFDKATIEKMKNQCVRFETEAGVIEMEMYPESAPETVRNFLNLTAIGAFDTTTFSRVVPEFVIQGGNVGTSQKLTAELAARASRKIPDEPNQILHERSVLSMARSDEPNTATSHFFILVGEASNLNGKFAAFGRVIKGMETVDAINKMPVVGDKPEKPVRIQKAIIFQCSTPTAP